MVVWNKSENNDSTPKDRRLLRQLSGAADRILGTQIFRTSSSGIGTSTCGVLSSLTNRTRPGAKLIVRYWKELPEMPAVKPRGLEGLA